MSWQSILKHARALLKKWDMKRIGKSADLGIKHLQNTGAINE